MEDDLGFGEFLKYLYRSGIFSGEYLTEDNLVKLFNYELTGNINFKMDNEELSEELIFHITHCDNALIRFCINELKNIGCEETAKTLESQYTILKLTFPNPKTFENIKERAEASKKQKKIFRPLGFTFLLVVLTLLCTQYLVGSSFGLNIFTLFMKPNQDQFVLSSTHSTGEEEIPEYFKWLPKGYKRDLTTFKDSEYISITRYEYICDDPKKTITLEVQKYTSSSSALSIEMNGEITSFILNGIIYYESDNYELNQITWNEYNLVYLLHGYVPKETLKDLIIKNKK